MSSEETGQFKVVQEVKDKETMTLNLVTVNHFFLLQIQ